MAGVLFVQGGAVLTPFADVIHQIKLRMRPNTCEMVVVSEIFAIFAVNSPLCCRGDWPDILENNKKIVITLNLNYAQKF